MRLLLLGGSWLLGRLIATDAASRGLDVTVFNRGRSPSPLSSDRVRQLFGDRANDDDLRNLARSGPWDVVVDISGKIPAVVGRTVRAFAGVAGRYVSVSSVTVYRDFLASAVDEDSPLVDCDPTFDPGPRGWQPPEYGFLKAGCETACREVFGDDRLLILRLHAMIGQHEDFDAIRWWLHRIRRGGAVLLPAPDRGIQPIDVRDVARFMVDQLERGTTGVFNVGAPAKGRTFGAMIRACTERARADGTPELVWADESWLIDEGVQPAKHLPLWEVAPGMWSVSVERAVAAGLLSRPFAATAFEAWNHLKDDRRPQDQKRFDQFGLDPAVEAALVARWRSRSGA